MKENRFFRQGFRGFFISLVCILLAVFAVTISAKYTYPKTPYCRDMVGAGFPVMFICDDWGGGSPTSSWGKIDFVDFINGGIIPTGLLIDLVFYFILFGFIWFTASSIIQKGLNRSDMWWTIFISIGFIIGLLFAFLVLYPSCLNCIGLPISFQRPTLISLPTSTGIIGTATPTHTSITTIYP